MKVRVMFAVVAALALTLLIAVAANAHDFNAPEGGTGDTPFNSAQGFANGIDHYLDAIDNSGGAAANALTRNPTCGVHGTPDGIHPPGNP